MNIIGTDMTTLNHYRATTGFMSKQRLQGTW